MFKRQGFLCAAMIALTGAALFTPAHSQSEADRKVYKIGALFALSGPYASLGTEAKRGIEIAIEERGGKIRGIPIEVIWEDTETKAQVAVQKATKVLSSNVDVVFGAVTSSETLAVSKLITSRKVPMIVPISGDPSITGEQKSPYVFRITKSSAMETSITVEGLKQVGFKKIYGVASDYATLRNDWGRAKTELAKAGQIAGEDFPPLGTTDYSVILNRIADSGADAAFLALAGSDGVNFLKQAGELKLEQKIQFAGPYLIDESQVKAAGPGAIGALSALRYHYGVDNAASKSFNEKYRAKYGQPATAFAGEGYDGMKWWLQNVEKVGSWDIEALVAGFEKSTLADSVLGVRVMRKCDHQAASDGILAKVVKDGQADPVMKIVATVKADTLIEPCKG